MLLHPSELEYSFLAFLTLSYMEMNNKHAFTQLFSEFTLIYSKILPTVCRFDAVLHIIIYHIGWGVITFPFMGRFQRTLEDPAVDVVFVDHDLTMKALQDQIRIKVITLKCFSRNMIKPN